MTLRNLYWYCEIQFNGMMIIEMEKIFQEKYRNWINQLRSLEVLMEIGEVWIAVG